VYTKPVNDEADWQSAGGNPCRRPENLLTKIMPTGRSSIRLFKCFGIDVFLHWSWFLVAVYEVQLRKGIYSSITWNIFEYLTLFLIVLLHEFGHALACRSVGGQAHQIVLWPFGGVAYASPPARPGATLWTIAAGPLVNVALIPILSALWWISGTSNWSDDLNQYISAVWVINVGLLIFNMMPVYPLDGGQILRALLWFPLGRARSLMVACVIGFLGAAGLAVVAILLMAEGLWSLSGWLGAICFLNFYYCFQSFVHAREMLRRGDAPRRDGHLCPTCGVAPPAGDYWHCRQCRKSFDPFTTQMACPHCGMQYTSIGCLDCGNAAAPGDWVPGELAKL
jgi:Zn-dependent protease